MWNIQRQWFSHVWNFGDVSQGAGMVDDKARMGHVVVSMVKGDVVGQVKKITYVDQCRRKKGGGFQI